MTLTINTVDGKTLRLENELAKQALSQIKERKEIITVVNKSVMRVQSHCFNRIKKEPLKGPDLITQGDYSICSKILHLSAWI